KPDELWISNAFGSFKEYVSTKYLDKRRKQFFKSLYDLLNKKSITNKSKSEKKKFWSEIRTFVFQEIKQWYSHLLSDSRYPINDITLWDQAYMTATMFKSALAAIELDNNKYSE